MNTSNSEAHASIGIQPSSVSSVRQQAKHEVTTSEFADRIAASLRKHKVNKPGCNNATSVKLGKLWEPASDGSEEGAYLSSLRAQRLGISVVDNGTRAEKSESQLLAEQRVASLRAAKQKREAAAAALAAENAKGHTNNNGQESEQETIHDSSERWIKPFESGTSVFNSLSAEESAAQAPAFMGEFISRDSFEYLRGYVFKMGDKGLGLYWDEPGNTLVTNSSCNNNKKNNATDLFAFGSTENRQQERAKALQDQRGSTQAISTGFNRHRRLTKKRGGLSSNRVGSGSEAYTTQDKKARERMEMKMSIRMESNQVGLHLKSQNQASSSSSPLKLNKALAAAQRRPSIAMREHAQKQLAAKIGKPGGMARTDFLKSLYA
jgi:hypothetical protein